MSLALGSIDFHAAYHITLISEHPQGIDPRYYPLIDTKTTDTYVKWHGIICAHPVIYLKLSLGYLKY